VGAARAGRAATAGGGVAVAALADFLLEDDWLKLVSA
jgi:hypothetical protein